MDALHLLPSTLMQDINRFMPRSILEQSEFFEGLEPGFLSFLVNNLRSRIAVPGETIVHSGHVGSKIYFIHSGTVRLTVGSYDRLLRFLNTGESFGEYSVLFRQRRSANAYADTYCMLYAVDEQDLSRAKSFFPTSHAILTHRVKKHKAQTMKIQENMKRKKARKLGSKSNLTLKKPVDKNSLPELPRISNKHKQNVGEDKLKKGPWILDPHSRFRSSWLDLMMVVILYNTLVVPFRSAFLYDRPENDSDVILAFDMITDILMWVDIVLSFRTAYIDTGYIMDDLKLIRGKYMRDIFGFRLDVIASLPLDLLFVIAGQYRNPLLRVTRVFKLVTLHRIVDEKAKGSSYFRQMNLMT